MESTKLSAPVTTLSGNILTGKVVPWRVKGFLPTLGKTTNDPGYLKLLLVKENFRQTVLRVMADQKLDALAYARADHQPTVIAADPESANFQQRSRSPRANLLDTFITFLVRIGSDEICG